MQLKSVWNGDLDDTIVYYCTGDAVTIRRVENSRNFHFPQFGFTEEVEWCIPDINLFYGFRNKFHGRRPRLPRNSRSLETSACCRLLP